MTPPPRKPSSARPSTPRASAGRSATGRPSAAGGYVKKAGPNTGGKSSGGGGGAPSGRAKAALKGSFDRAPKRGPKRDMSPKSTYEPRTPREGVGESASTAAGMGEKKIAPRKPAFEGRSARGAAPSRSPREGYGDSTGDKKPYARKAAPSTGGPRSFERSERPAFGAKTFGSPRSGAPTGRPAMGRPTERPAGRPVGRPATPRNDGPDAAPRRSYQAFESKLEKPAPRRDSRENRDSRDSRPSVAPRTGARPLSNAARSKDDALWLEPGEKGANYPVGIPWVVGRNAVLAILKQSPKRIIKLFMAEGMGTERRLKAIQDTAREHGLTIQYVERPDLDKRCEQLDDPDVAHQGVLAEVLPKDALSLYELMDKLKAAKGVEGLTPATQPLIIALDKITDPRNVGAILRVADGVGAMAVVMPKRNQAGWGPALSKSASGADATVDIVMVPNLVMALKELKDAGGWVVGAAGEDDTELYTDYKFDRPTVLVMGSEGDGLSRLTRATCDYLVRIPMMGAMTSLNVSTATAVLAYGWRAAKQP